MKDQLNIVLILLLTALVGCDSAKSQPKKAEKPNILLLIADDMGYGDIGCYGGVSETPNIDQLAKDGILFTDFYAAASNCSPSRAGLLTGISPAKLGMYSYRPVNHPMHLRNSEVTIAEVLKGEGYQTSHFGKWHLGCLPQDPALNQPQPSDQGFDYSLGTENNAKPTHFNPVNFVRNGEELGMQQGYACQIVADDAINWLEDRQEKTNPFFMYVAFQEPHAIVESPPELVEKYNQYPKEDAEYLASIENIDLAVGKIKDYLTEKGLLENTLIVFSSDNGSYRQASNGGLRAVKSYVYEGGIRVPGIVHWPKLKKSGTVINEAAGFVDIMPTICDILKIKTPKNKELDGTSILNVLEGKKFERQNPLYWYFYRTSPEIAMRVGNRMILGKDNDTVLRTHPFTAPDMAYIKGMDIDSYELYDLANDIGEEENLDGKDAKSTYYQGLLANKLKEIQEKGYLWEDLPEPQTGKRVKTEWVKYTREQ